MLNLWNKKLTAYLLWPLSLLYRMLSFFRHKLYQFHLLKTAHFSVPVIVVGNITVGGSGKTPLVIEIVEFLKKKGWRPGIISRGYGGKTHYPCRVHAKSNPREVGDEPLLMVRHTQCPTLVDPNRRRGVRALIAKANCNIIVSDDGLQHLALGRDIEIAVIDGQRRFGNGFCLPAGPLREPISRLKTVDFKVTKGKPASSDEFEMNLLPSHFYQLIQPENKKQADYFYGKKLHAIAGIGNPDQFFNSLRTLGLTFIEHPFPDHHFFKPRDFNFGKNAVILMTEKDAVKCTGLVDARLWCLKAKAKIDETFFTALLHRISTLNDNPKSSSNSF